MSSLKQLQHNFIEALLNNDKKILENISSNSPQDRIEVYRNTVFNGLCHSLEVIYPGIWKLLGKKCADRAALIFCKLPGNLPSNGNLDSWGMRYSKFLGSVPAFNELPYLADYAWYEFLWHQAYCGYGKTVYFFESIFPINEIQELLDDPNPDQLDLKPKSSYAIIMRPEQKVMTLWVTKEKWHSLKIQEAEYA